MKKVSVTEAKNGFSRLLAEVGRGESVLIVHRGTPESSLHTDDGDLDDAAAQVQAL